MGGWRIRTLGMFVALSAILMAIGAGVACIFSPNFWYYGLLIMLVVSLLVCFASYYFSKEMALKAYRVRLITEQENPRLYHIVQEVAEKAGVPMPEVGISPIPEPNAFATGRNPSNAAVVCTEGILRLLPDDELKGVIAHEMSHVRNRDILVMSIAAAMSSIISYVTSMAYWMVLFGGDRENRGWMLVIAILAQIFVPFAALMIQLGISRNREFLADETGAKIIRDPRALARALDHLDRGIARQEEDKEKQQHSYTLENQGIGQERNPNDNQMTRSSYECMMIASPTKKTSLVVKLFSTHPPMEERIARLNALADKMDRGEI